MRSTSSQKKLQERSPIRTESKSPSAKQLSRTLNLFDDISGIGDLQNSHKVLNTSQSSRLLKNLTTKPLSKLSPNPLSLTNLSFRTSPSPRANQTTTTPRQVRIYLES